MAKQYRPLSMLVRSSLETCFYTLSPSATVGQAVEALCRRRRSAVAVVDAGRIQGIVTRTDILKLLKQTDSAEPCKLPLSRIMTKRLYVTGPEKPMREVLEDMTQAGVEHVPVLDEGELLTIVHERDIMQSQIDAMQDDILHLREYIKGLHHAAQD